MEQYRVVQQVENFEDKEFQNFLSENKIESEKSFRYKGKGVYMFKGEKDALLSLTKKYFNLEGGIAESWVHQKQKKVAKK
jgi:hypothetical protein